METVLFTILFFAVVGLSLALIERIIAAIEYKVELDKFKLWYRQADEAYAKLRSDFTTLRDQREHLGDMLLKRAESLLALRQERDELKLRLSKILDIAEGEDTIVQPVEDMG